MNMSSCTAETDGLSVDEKLVRLPSTYAPSSLNPDHCMGDTLADTIKNKSNDFFSENQTKIPSHSQPTPDKLIGDVPNDAEISDVADALVNIKEAPLRRSNRGKTRHFPSEKTNSEDAMQSCIYGSIEYKPGDNVYYEEQDFDYFTIGLIEEIKLSRREKCSVIVKCFWRTRDIPDIAKQAMVDRDEVSVSPFGDLTVSQQKILNRELFVSDLQFTIYSNQLRGKCQILQLPNLRTALTTFDDKVEDSFFFVYAYNPETRRLMATRAEIKVGPAYQVEFLPPCRVMSDFEKRTSSQRLHRPKDSQKSCEHAITATDKCSSQSNCPLSQNSYNKSCKFFANHCKRQGGKSIYTDLIRKRFKPEGDVDLKNDFTKVETTKNHELLVTRKGRCWETLTWLPTGLNKGLNVPQVDNCRQDPTVYEEASFFLLKTYLDAVRSLVASFAFGGSDDDLVSAENGLVMANLATTVQHAYDTLHENQYCLEKALEAVKRNPIVSNDTPQHWTAEQVQRFYHAMSLRGKDFHSIQKEFFSPSSTINSHPELEVTSSSSSSNFAGTCNKSTPSSRHQRGRRRRAPALSQNTSCANLEILNSTCNLPTTSAPCLEHSNSLPSLFSLSTEHQQDVVSDERAEFVQVCPSSSDPLTLIEHADVVFDQKCSKTESFDCIKPENKLESNSEASELTLTEDNKEKISPSPGQAAAIFYPSPVKSVKQLVTFYYYWKRKCNSMMSVAAATAAVASAVSSNIQPVTTATKHTHLTAFRGSCVETNFNTGYGSKKRRPTGRGGIPSESISNSRAESEAEDTGTDTPPRPDHSADKDAGECSSPDALSVHEEPSTDIEAGENYSPSQKLQRTCKNCSNRLSPPTASSDKYLSSQLRLLCNICRSHLRKYGELRNLSEETGDSLINSRTENILTKDSSGGLLTLDEEELKCVSATPHSPPSSQMHSCQATEVEKRCSPESQCSFCENYSPTYALFWFSQSPETMSSQSSTRDTESCSSNLLQNNIIHQNSHSDHEENLIHGDVDSEVDKIYNISTVTAPGQPEINTIPIQDIHGLSRTAENESSNKWAIGQERNPCEDDIATIIDPETVDLRNHISITPEPISPSEEAEVCVILKAQTASPKPCCSTVHQSKFSALERIWDRSVVLPSLKPNDSDGPNYGRLNSGSCARTDIVLANFRSRTTRNVNVSQNYHDNCSSMTTNRTKSELDTPQVPPLIDDEYNDTDDVHPIELTSKAETQKKQDFLTSFIRQSSQTTTIFQPPPLAHSSEHPPRLTHPLFEYNSHPNIMSPSFTDHLRNLKASDFEMLNHPDCNLTYEQLAMLVHATSVTQPGWVSALRAQMHQQPTHQYSRASSPPTHLQNPSTLRLAAAGGTFYPPPGVPPICSTKAVSSNRTSGGGTRHCSGSHDVSVTSARQNLYRNSQKSSVVSTHTIQMPCAHHPSSSQASFATTSVPNSAIPNLNNGDPATAEKLQEFFHQHHGIWGKLPPSVSDFYSSSNSVPRKADALHQFMREQLCLASVARPAGSISVPMAHKLVEDPTNKSVNSDSLGHQHHQRPTTNFSLPNSNLSSDSVNVFSFAGSSDVSISQMMFNHQQEQSAVTHKSFAMMHPGYASQFNAFPSTSSISTLNRFSVPPSISVGFPQSQQSPLMSAVHCDQSMSRSPYPASVMENFINQNLDSNQNSLLERINAFAKALFTNANLQPDPSSDNNQALTAFTLACMARVQENQLQQQQQIQKQIRNAALSGHINSVSSSMPQPAGQLPQFPSAASAAALLSHIQQQQKRSHNSAHTTPNPCNIPSGGERGSSQWPRPLHSHILPQTQRLAHSGNATGDQVGYHHGAHHSSQMLHSPPVAHHNSSPANFQQSLSHFAGGFQTRDDINMTNALALTLGSVASPRHLSVPQTLTGLNNPVNQSTLLEYLRLIGQFSVGYPSEAHPPQSNNQ